MKKNIFIFLLMLQYQIVYSQTSRNIVVSRIGSGNSKMISGVAQPVYLDVYNQCGTLINTIEMPTSVSGNNRRLTLPVSTGDYSEGFISLSQDGMQLAIPGYDANVGTPGVSGISSATVNRVIGIVSLTNNSYSVNTSTAFNNRFSMTAIRSAVVDGNNIWATGGSSGIVSTTIGNVGSNNTLLSLLTGRCLSIYNSKLYTSTTTSGFRMATVGTGLPTTTGQVLTNLPGYSTTSNPYQYFLTTIGSSNQPDVLYVADNDTLKKFSLVSGMWNYNGFIGTASDKYKGVTGYIENNTVTLLAVRRNDNAFANGGEIVKFIDGTTPNTNFSNTNPIIVVQSDSNKVFRSIAMAPLGAAAAQRSTFVSNTSFSGELVDNNVKLEWLTNNASTVESFTIKKSVDGVNFFTIGKVEPNQSPSKNGDYNFIDANPFNGISYYKLEQLGRNSKIITSKLVSIKNIDKLDFITISTENKSGIDIYVTSETMLLGDIMVYDINGKILATKKVSVIKGLSKINIPITFIARGIYIITIKSNKGDLLTKKMIY